MFFFPLLAPLLHIQPQTPLMTLTFALKTNGFLVVVEVLDHNILPAALSLCPTGSFESSVAFDLFGFLQA